VNNVTVMVGMFDGARFPQDPSRFAILDSEDVVMGNA
jgi:hypothetical protein